MTDRYGLPGKGSFELYSLSYVPSKRLHASPGATVPTTVLAASPLTISCGRAVFFAENLGGRVSPTAGSFLLNDGLLQANGLRILQSVVPQE